MPADAPQTPARGTDAPSSQPSPYDDALLYDRALGELDFDLPFWRAVAREANGPVLEVGCGTGRVLLALLQDGIDADGLDLSPAMLARLREKAATQNLRANVTVGDMRSFTLDRRYARILCAFNSFAHCDTTDEQIAALRCIRAHLVPGGSLVLHLSYPQPSYWSGPDGEPVFEIEQSLPNGRALQMWDTRFKDVVNQRQRSETEVREVEGGATVVSHRFWTTQRWVYRYELELLFRVAGFAHWEIQGDFERGPLERASQQMLGWAWNA